MQPPVSAVGCGLLRLSEKIVMENPTKFRKRLSIVNDAETDARITRVKHLLESNEKQRISVSELFRRAMKQYEIKLTA